MKIVNVPGYGAVSFPDEMPDGEIQERARRIQAKAEAKFGYQPDYRELGLGELIKGGFKRSASRLGSTVTDLIPAMLGTAVGEYGYAREQLKEAEEKRAAAEEESPTGFRSFRDIRGPGDLLSFIAETGGEVTPDLASTLIGGGIAGVDPALPPAHRAERGGELGADWRVLLHFGGLGFELGPSLAGCTALDLGGGPALDRTQPLGVSGGRGTGALAASATVAAALAAAGRSP